jgi:hypothetical protein
MSTSGNVCPDRINDGQPHPGNPGKPEKHPAATDRGDSVDESSRKGIERYETVPFTEALDAVSRRTVAISLLILLGLITVIGVAALVILSISGAPTRPTEKFLDQLLQPAIPIITLAVGYFFGRKSKS